MLDFVNFAFEVQKQSQEIQDGFRVSILLLLAGILLLSVANIAYISLEGSRNGIRMRSNYWSLCVAFFFVEILPVPYLTLYFSRVPCFVFGENKKGTLVQDRYNLCSFDSTPSRINFFALESLISFVYIFVVYLFKRLDFDSRIKGATFGAK